MHLIELKGSSFNYVLFHKKLNMMVTFHAQGKIISLRHKASAGFHRPEVPEEPGDFSEKRWPLQKWIKWPVVKLMLSGRISFSGSLVFCHTKILRNLFNNAIMHTVCPPSYYDRESLNLGMVYMSLYGYSIFLFIRKKFGSI